jgi:hypothetical protein
MLDAPAAGEPTIKTLTGKKGPWTWCPKHEAWRRHNEAAGLKDLSAKQHAEKSRDNILKMNKLLAVINQDLKQASRRPQASK